VRDACATPGPPCSFSLSATRVAAGAAISANAVCVAMPATMTHESSNEPQASTFALYCPGFARRAVLPPLPARRRPMKSPPMSMFPKASLTGRVVLSKNTMRMAKSWGHSGGPVPAPKCCFVVASARLRSPITSSLRADELHPTASVARMSEATSGVPACRCAHAGYRKELTPLRRARPSRASCAARAAAGRPAA
jgi:hypothetical protein